MAKKAREKKFIPCTAVIPDDDVAAANTAVSINPANRPSGAIWGLLQSLMPDDEPMLPKKIAAVTSRYWGSAGVKLGVGFLDNPPASVRNKILSVMNLWGGTRANVKFTEAATAGAQIRIARASSGYWSFIGTDCLSIPAGQATLNLQGFTDRTSDSEYLRVVGHEAGHALSFPHEHARRDIVARLDRAKTIAYFQRTQGWSEQEVMQQVLTPLDERSLMSTPADVTSIMTYQLPSSITTDGKPIVGGNIINESDLAFCGKIYPLPMPPVPPVPPAPPPPPVAGIVAARITWNAATGQWSIAAA